MKEVLRRFMLAAALVFAAATAFPMQAEADLSGAAIIEKAVLRAQSAREQQQTPYTFNKVTVREERDLRGQLKTRKEVCDAVVFRNGVYSRIPAATAGKSSAARIPAALSAKPKAIKRDDYLRRLTPDMLDRFVFANRGTTNCNSRTVHIIDFFPKPGKSEAKEFSERIANKTVGTLWIDTEEFELVRAKGRIQTEVTVGGGWLGALKRAVFSVERVRLENGVWFERLFESNYEARKLAESRRVTTRTEFSDFRPLL